MLTYSSKNYFIGLCEEYSPGSSHCRPSTRVRMPGFWRSRGIFHCNHCLPRHSDRLQIHFVLSPNRLNNYRRVPYEEVRLPPTTNQRCDLYVDDEVEVNWKTCLAISTLNHVIELQRGHSPEEGLDCFHSCCGAIAFNTSIDDCLSA